MDNELGNKERLESKLTASEKVTFPIEYLAKAINFAINYNNYGMCVGCLIIPDIS